MGEGQQLRLPEEFLPREAHARRTDPATSHKRTDPTGLHEAVVAAARLCLEERVAITDSALTGRVEAILARRVERGVVARARLRLERRGWFCRLPLAEGSHQMEFRFIEGGDPDVEVPGDPHR